MDIHRSPDPERLASSAAAYLADRIDSVIRHHGVCHLALAGGYTPQATYHRLHTLQADWRHLHIWFGDERCLPPGHPDRNDTMAREALLDHLPIPAAQLHMIKAELGPQTAAAYYSRELAAIDHIDIALLGLGEDGHTASLFPDHASLTLDEPAIPVFDAPKAPAERVSLSIKTLKNAGERVILATGSGKAAVLERIHRGEMLPAAMIGSARWFADAAACAALSKYRP